MYISCDMDFHPQLIGICPQCPQLIGIDPWLKLALSPIFIINWYWSIINWQLSPISIINWYRSSRAAAAYYWRNNQGGSGSLSNKKDKTYYWRRYLSCVNHQYLLDNKDKINTWLHISDILCHSCTIVLKYLCYVQKSWTAILSLRHKLWIVSACCVDQL